MEPKAEEGALGAEEEEGRGGKEERVREGAGGRLAMASGGGSCRLDGRERERGGNPRLLIPCRKE